MRVLGVFSALACVGMAQATILTFGFATANRNDVAQTYGDNVTSTTGGYEEGLGWTPNVTMQWGNNSQVALNNQWEVWLSGWTDNFDRVAYFDPEPVQNFEFSFTADPGYFVALHGFAMPNFGVTITGVRMRISDQGDNTLFSGPLTWNNNTLYADFSSAPLVGRSLRVFFDVSGINNTDYADYFGIDNVSFSQAPVPEPGTMLALGLGAAFLARRRRK